MTIESFLAKLESPRKEIITAIHNILVKTNKKVVPEVSSMMGKEMIIYKMDGGFIYGLASVKSHMSLHMMPIYGSPTLHAKYKKLLNKASFQKGCINFKNAEEMPLDIVKQLLEDCSKVDYKAMMAMFKSKKK